jgi:hypothetical protein
VGKKGKGKSITYLIKWKGSTHKTWEPKSHLGGAMQMVKDYDKKKRAKVKASLAGVSPMGLADPDPNPDPNPNPARGWQGAAEEGSAGGEPAANPNPEMRHDKHNTTLKPDAIVPLFAACMVVGMHVDAKRTSDPDFTPYSHDEIESVINLLYRMGEEPDESMVLSWLPGYKKEMEHVSQRRLTMMGDVTYEMKRDAIPLRMILEQKRDGRRKGRLILQGFREPRSYDRGAVDSPVAYLSSIRSFIFGPTKNDEVLSSIDVSVAFLQADEFDDDEKPRYVKYTPYKGANTVYYKLRGPLYGQRSSPRRWFETLKGWLISKEMGFIQGENELCAFTNPKTGVKLVGWVDDLLVKGTQQATDQFYRDLNKKFECKDPSFLTVDSPLDYVGFTVGLNETEGGYKEVYIEQTTQVQDFLEEFECPPAKFAGDPSPCFTKSALYSDVTPLSEEESRRYARIVGSLNYFASSLRYDIALPTSKLSQFMSKPTVAAMRCATRVMEYLAATSDFRITGRVTDQCDYIHYSDSDHAGEKPYHTRSQSGILLTLNKVPVQWKSNKQSSTAYSSTAAEVMALSECVRQANFLQWAGADMGYPDPSTLTIYTDSKGARSFQSSTTLDSRLKGYFDLREAWVGELRDAGRVKLEKIEGRQNLSDLLTKLLRPAAFNKNVKAVQGTRRSQAKYKAKAV